MHGAQTDLKSVAICEEQVRVRFLYCPPYVNTLGSGRTLNKTGLDTGSQTVCFLMVATKLGRESKRRMGTARALTLAEIPHRPNTLLNNMSKTQKHADEEVTLSRGYFSNLKANAYTHEFYLSGSIEGPEEYIDWFNVIRNASEYDTIKIYINSGGGDLNTALQFMRVLADTDAATIASIEGSCMSAATMVMLSCDAIEISPHSLCMIHNYSGGTIGKGGEMVDQILFERDWSRLFLADVYKWFLSSDEIESILNNRDIWLTSEQVAERLKTVLEMRQLETEDEKSDLEESAQ